MTIQELNGKVIELESKVGRLEGKLNNLQQIINNLPALNSPQGGVPEPTQKAPKLLNGKNNHKF